MVSGFYLDPYSRPNEKLSGAWMQSLLDRVVSFEGKTFTVKQKPVAVICCNASPPVENQASLMNFNEIKTLFHEFG